MPVRTTSSLLERTVDALDCIDIAFYINVSDDEMQGFLDDICAYDLLDIMALIQLDYERERLPYDAMRILNGRDFHYDVFRGMDEEDFLHYLEDRYLS